MRLVGSVGSELEMGRGVLFCRRLAMVAQHESGSSTVGGGVFGGRETTTGVLVRIDMTLSQDGHSPA
jgi:hypothetical protein